MLRCYVDTPAGNAALTDGSLPQIIAELSEMIKPEAAYFFPDKGKRCCIMVFDLENTNDIPRIGEPLFMKLNAEVDIFPIMTGEELQQGIGKMKMK
jgi:hypothetical protein